MDKILLLRYYSKPPNISENSIRIIISCLPYAGIIRLAFSCWILSNNTIFYTTNGVSIYAFNIKLSPAAQLNSSSYLYYLSVYKYYYGGIDTGYSFIEGRIFEPAIFPLFVLLVIIVLIKILIKVYLYLVPYRVTYKFFKYIFSCACCNKVKVHVTDANGVVRGLTEQDLNHEVSRSRIS